MKTAILRDDATPDKRAAEKMIRDEPAPEYPRTADLRSSTWRRLPPAERALGIAERFCEIDAVDLEREWIGVFLTFAHAERGTRWGAAFAAYCLGQAGRPVFARNYGEGVRYPAFPASWVDWARYSGRWSHTPRRGRIFVLASRGCSRMGFVVHTFADGSFDAIESDETRVVRSRRFGHAVSGFIDIGK